MSVKQVLQVAAEAAPLLKTGGLADVVGALPQALLALGVDSRVVLPGVDAVMSALHGVQVVSQLRPPWSRHPLRLLRGVVPRWDDTVVYTIDAPTLYQRPGGLYADAHGVAWPDNHRRFAPLAWAALALAQGADASWRPQVVHAHDWHAGLAPAALHHAGRPAASVMTIHNLAYQGLFPPAAFWDVDLPPKAYAMHGCEFHGQLSFMKAGLHHADALSTVSPTYAREVLQPEFGCGLDGVLRAHPAGVEGILNGVDTRVWNPATDVALPRFFSAQALHGKAECKAQVQAQFQLPTDPEALLHVVVSRLTEQKGLHLILEALDTLLAAPGAQLLVLGQGDPVLEAAFAEAARVHPGRVVLCRAHDEALSHRLFAAADVVLVPSRFEPCGLTQMYAMAYGALPLVHHVGGLADTVVDCSLEHLHDHRATGFVFHGHSATALAGALRRAQVLWAQPQRWAEVQQQAMAQRFDWHRAAQAYLGLYQRAATLAACPSVPPL